MAKIPRREPSPGHQRINQRIHEERKTLKQRLVTRAVKDVPFDNALRKWVGKIDTTGS